MANRMYSEQMRRYEPRMMSNEANMASYEVPLVRRKWQGGIFMPVNCIKEGGGQLPLSVRTSKPHHADLYIMSVSVHR